MAKDSDDLADSFAADEQGGWLTRLLADEEELDPRGKWRLASWAAVSLGALVIAITANQNSLERRRDQVAAADLARQSQRIQQLAKQSQSEATRLAAAIDTLNADRDRLYSRVGSLEQNLDSVTGSISRLPASKPAPNDKAAVAALPEIPVKGPAAQPASVEPKVAAAQSAPSMVAPPAPSPPKRAAEPAAAGPEQPAPTAAQAAPPAHPAAAVPPPAAESEMKRTEHLVLAPTSSPATPPTQPLMAARSILAPPDAAAGKLYGTPPATQPAPQPSAPQAEPDGDAADERPVAVPRTTFGVELGGANSVEGLRNLWRRMSKTHKELKDLQPIIMVKENSSGGQLRLVAGPLNDAAAAAKLCATLGAADRACETSVFDGQRLPMASAAPPPPRQPRKRPPKVTTVVPEPTPPPEAPPPPPQPKPGPLSSILGIR